MTKAKAAAAPAPAPVDAQTQPSTEVAVQNPPEVTDNAAPEAPATEGIHLRTVHGVTLVNPYTTQAITPAGVEVVRLDGWLDFQIESGKVQRYTPEAAAE